MMRGDPISEDVALDRDMQAHIGRELQKIYEEIAHVAVPDQFVQLLDQLERREAHQP